MATGMLVACATSKVDFVLFLTGYLRIITCTNVFSNTTAESLCPIINFIVNIFLHYIHVYSYYEKMISHLNLCLLEHITVLIIKLLKLKSDNSLLRDCLDKKKQEKNKVACECH